MKQEKQNDDGEAKVSLIRSLASKRTAEKMKQKNPNYFSDLAKRRYRAKSEAVA